MLENLSPSLASSPPLYPFGVFLRFLPSRPSWTLAVLCRNSIAFTGAFPFSTRTNRTAGIQLKESTSKGNHLDQREREKEREGESTGVQGRDRGIYIYIYINVRTNIFVDTIYSFNIPINGYV